MLLMESSWKRLLIIFSHFSLNLWKFLDELNTLIKQIWKSWKFQNNFSIFIKVYHPTGAVWVNIFIYKIQTNSVEHTIRYQSSRFHIFADEAGNGFSVQPPLSLTTFGIHPSLFSMRAVFPNVIFLLISVAFCCNVPNFCNNFHAV